MALTLAQSALLSQDHLLAGVFETVIDEDPVLFSLMQWLAIQGNSLAYNRENALATVADFAVGDVWTEGIGTVSQVTTALTVIGGDADVDQFLQTTRSSINDQKAIAIASKAKALARGLSDRFVYGNTAVANQMAGLHQLMPTAQKIHQGAGAIGAALSLANLDVLCDTVRPRPDILMMPRAIRRRLSAYGRGSATSLIETREAFGRQQRFFNDIPIAVSDFMVMTETIAAGDFTAKTGGATGSIIALRFGEDAAVMVHGGGSPIIVEDVGTLETKDATRTRIKAYAALALLSTLAVARIDGITDVAVVA